jgi:hypothetical protein
MQLDKFASALITRGNMLEIKGAVAVITGASGGIGGELAKYWVGQGGK